jgi:maltose O-acetyltransferase
MAKEKSELEKLMAGEVYCYDDPEVENRKQGAVRACERLEAIPSSDQKARAAALRSMFGSCGSVIQVQKGFMCDYGKNIFVGENFSANYRVTILDIARVDIGDNVMIGPNVTIATVGHPLDPEGRRRHLAFAKPIKIGNDVWIGANVVILPGVTIGDNVVIGAGAVVTKDLPGGTVCAGVPAKVIKNIS